MISSSNKLTKQVIKINNDFNEKSEIFCKCGRFLYYTKKGWLDVSTRVKVKTDKEVIVLKCQCGETAEIKLKDN